MGRTPSIGRTFSPVIIRIPGPVRMGTLYDLAYYGALHSNVVVAWGVDPRQISNISMHTWYNGWQSSATTITTSSSYNIVMLGGYPRSLWQQPKQVPSQTWDYWERQGIMKEIRRSGEHWMFRCEEYDAEAIDQLLEEAEPTV